MEIKRNIIERMGGLSYFDVIVYQMCERILEDPRLKKYFGHCHVDDLFDMQRVLMDLAIRDFGDDEESKQKVYDRALLQHFRLFQHGLNVEHFDILKSHLIASLQDGWCEADVMEDLLELFESLRTIFYRSGCHFTTILKKSDDSAEFELSLNKGQTRDSSSQTEGVPKRCNGIRHSSGDNLLSMLKLKRPKGFMTTPQQWSSNHCELLIVNGCNQRDGILLDAK